MIGNHMNIHRIASKISGSLSDRPDYGEGEAALPRGDEKTSVIRKTPGEDEWCVYSEKNPDWSGGCTKSPEMAKERLKEVEMFKHMNKK